QETDVRQLNFGDFWQYIFASHPFGRAAVMVGNASIQLNSLRTCGFADARIGYSRIVFARPTDYVIRPLTPQDEPILWEMLYHGLSEPAAPKPASRDILRRPEISKYVAGWGRPGDIGFVAHEKRGGALIGAVWLRQPTDRSG